MHLFKKGKFHLRTSQKDKERELEYSSTLSLTSTLDEMDG
jgi:hypothetical protein